MLPSTLAAEKDMQPPTGHPALAYDSPLESSSLKSPPARYYQRFPPTEAAERPTSTTTEAISTATEASEFDFRSTAPAHVKEEPTILDKMREVLHLHKRH